KRRIPKRGFPKRLRPKLRLAPRRALKVALSLLELHRSLFVVIDGAIFALGAAEGEHLLDDFGERVSLGADRAGARNASEGAHANLHHLRLFARVKLAIGMNHDNRSAADDHTPLASEIERHDGDIFLLDIEPDVELGPIGEGEYPNRFALVDARVEDVPQLRALIFGIPLPLA